ncbi:MAG: peptidoglycan-binding protein [Rhizobiales bacterium]|nr:peptidoglycan-binding protein [Hyphomicrobiales bacterium]
MTSANALKRFGIYGLLLAAGLVGLSVDLRAQPATTDNAAAADGNENGGVKTIDRGKMRLQLLINLVGNEQQEARLLHARLTAEASGLDQERRRLLSAAPSGTEAEKRQIDVIEERLQQIDQEVAAVSARLPEIDAELADLQVRLDEANGIVREPETDAAANGTYVDSASRWLDGKRQIQEALVYLAGYNALIDGDFGRRTIAAINVYQARQGVEQTGRLTEAQQAALLKEADLLRARYGMTTIEDRERGYRVSYPSGLLPVASASDSGMRYTSKDGKGELALTSSEEGEARSSDDLTALYEDLVSQYDVQYRRNRDDWFVVAGLVNEGRIVYDTARLIGDRIIRARLSYPAEWRDLWSPFAVMMFNTFEPLQAAES